MGSDHVADKSSQDHVENPFPRPGKPISQEGQSCKNIGPFTQGSRPEVHVGQKHKYGNGVPTLKFRIEAQVFLHENIEIYEAPKTHPSGQKHHHVVVEAQPLGKRIIDPFDKQSPWFKSIKPICIPPKTIKIGDGVRSIKLGISPIDQAKKHMVPVHLIQEPCL